MLLLKATVEEQKKQQEKRNKSIQKKIQQLKGSQKKKFDDKVKERMEAWTRDYIAGKTAPFMDDIISGRERIPPEYQKRYDKLKDTIEEQLKYPGISKLTATKDDLFDDEFDVADLSIGDITIDFDDVINKNQLKKLWIEKTKGADKKFPDVKTADYDYLVDDDEDSVSRLEYKSKYSKEALKAPKKEKGESAEDFETRKKQHQALKEEYENDKFAWEGYSKSFGKFYPESIEDLVKNPDEKDTLYSTVVFQDFEEKMSEILKDVKAYDTKKVKSQYQSKKLAEMLAKNESMRKLLEEIKQEKLAPPQDKVDAKRKRVEKAVFLGLSGTTLPTGGEDRGTFGPLKEGQVREFEGAFDVIGRWIKDSNLRREFLDARSKNQSEVKLENEVEEYNDLVNTLFDKKRAKHLRDRGIPSGKQVIGSKKAAETKIRKYLSKEFGVKGVVIKQSGRDIIVEFSERSRTRQENVEAVKRAMNAQARYESAPESGKVVAGRERKLQREAVAAYERISPKIRDLLKKLLYKGKVAKDAIDLSELFITKDSEWNGTSWDNPVVREDANGMEATEMMKELMESAGEDSMKPPRKVKEIDVARRKGRFAQELSGRKKDARTLDLDDILERYGKERPDKPSALRGLSLEAMEKLRSGLKSTKIDALIKNKPRYDTLRKTLVFLEDEIEDNLKLLDRRRKVEGGEELIQAQLKGVANVVAYFQVSSKDQIGRKRYTEMKKIIERLQGLRRDFNADLQMPLVTTTEEQSQQDRKAERIARRYSRAVKRIEDDFQEIRDEVDLTGPTGEQKGKSPFRGSLKQALLSHATKVDFDLDDAIDESERMVEAQYEPIEQSNFQSIIEEFNDVMRRFNEMVETPKEFMGSFDKDKPEDKPRLRRRKSTDKTKQQSARILAQKKKKLVAELREKNPKMSLAQIEDMATQQLKSKMREG
jgi:hypothetical protein